ncbi:MFS transporter [Pseudactinotalea sp. HY160]|nr:MFS transporter [Pseudactinotalea sp. HY160]
MVLRPYRTILRHPGAAGFSAAGVLARLPISMVTIAIVLLISSAYDRYAVAGGVAAVYTIAQALCAPRLAVLVDRHGQARVMRPAITLALLGLTALTYLAAIRAPAAWLFVTAALAGAAVGSVPALVRARWNALVSDPRELHTAYSLESVFDELTFALGPVVATFLATEVSPVFGLVTGIVAAGIGSYWFLAQRGTEPPAGGGESGGSGRAEADPADTAEPADTADTADTAGTRGMAAPGSAGRSVIRSAPILLVSVVFVFLGVVFGAADVATVGYTEELGRKSWAGVVLGALAAGSLVAGLLYGTHAFVTPVWKRFVISLGALALGSGLLIVTHHLVAVFAVMLVTGLAIAPTIIAGNSLVQELVPRARLTEGLTWVSTAIGVGVAAGSSMSGLIVDRVGAHSGYLVVVAAAVLGALLALAGAPTLRRHYEARPAAD